MNDIEKDILSLEELCEITFMTKSTIVTIVEHGIIEPIGSGPEKWQFDTPMLVTTRKAIRLHHDLEIDWPGIAFALLLIDDLEQLREEKNNLEMRLKRYEEIPEA